MLMRKIFPVKLKFKQKSKRKIVTTFNEISCALNYYI